MYLIVCLTLHTLSLCPLVTLCHILSVKVFTMKEFIHLIGTKNYRESRSPIYKARRLHAVHMPNLTVICSLANIYKSKQNYFYWRRKSLNRLNKCTVKKNASTYLLWRTLTLSLCLRFSVYYNNVQTPIQSRMSSCAYRERQHAYTFMHFITQRSCAMASCSAAQHI